MEVSIKMPYDYNGGWDNSGSYYMGYFDAITMIDLNYDNPQNLWCSQSSFNNCCPSVLASGLLTQV